MKKEKVKVQVLRRMTEGEIKTLGGNLWMRRRAKWLVVVGVLCLVWMLGSAINLGGWIGFVASILPILVLLFVWMLRMDKEGKRLWNYVKDREQPVDLG